MRTCGCLAIGVGDCLRLLGMVSPRTPIAGKRLRVRLPFDPRLLTEAFLGDLLYINHIYWILLCGRFMV